MVIQPKAPSSRPARISAPQKSRGDRPRTRLIATRMSPAWELFFWLSSLMPAVAPRNTGVSRRRASGISASASSRQSSRLSPAWAGSKA